MKIGKLWVLAVLTTLFPFSGGAASNLDLTFDPGTGADGIVEQVLPLADGKILICGNFTTYNGRSRPYIARLNSNGSLDDTFFGQASYWVRHMSVQPDGKIIIGGFFNGVQGVPRGLIARLNSDGSLDTSFDPGTGATDTLGVAIDGNADPFVFWTAIQPDGKIIATGNFRNYNGASSTGIVRINPDGSRDPSFNVGSGLDSWGRSIRLQPNGQIVLSGWFTSYNGHSFNRLVKINPDGSPDTTFNPYFGDRTSIYSTAAVAGDKMIVSGHSLNYDGLFSREMERLNPDGSVDASWPAYTNEKTESIAVQPDGKIIIGGYFNAVNGQTRQSVARLFPDGTLDDSLQATIDNYVWTVALQADGKLLISGGFYTVDGVSRRGVARLLTGVSGGTPPPAPALTATANSSSQITLSWSDSATDRDGYTVQRKTGANGTYANVAPLEAAARSYVNSGLTPVTQYYYRLRATTTSGAVVYSNESAATTANATGGSATATFISSDTARHGSWKGAYGSEGYDVISDAAAYPSYVQVTSLNNSDWVWEWSTSDQDALEKVNSADRVAACWYSSSAFAIDFAITDGQKHRVSLYFLDWDVAGRNQTIQVVDGDTGAVLNTQNIVSFAGGVYLTWEIGGHVKINITPNNFNAVVSGIFFGPISTTQQTVQTPTISPHGGTYTSAQSVTLACGTSGAEIRYTLNGSDPTSTSTLYTGPFTVSSTTTVKTKGFKSGMLASATEAATFTISSGSGGSGWVYIGNDTTTKGSWQGAYGADGYNVIENGASYPAYAQISVSGKQDWIWQYTTADSRGLQTTDGASRLAACWYSSGSFTVDVNLTDGATHRVSFYVCDWDYGARTQMVDLINVDTGVVLRTISISSFSGGRYLIWDLKGHYKVRFNKSAGPNAVVSGLFFDAPAKQL